MHSEERLLISGGAGFIATRVVSQLDADTRVALLDNLHPQVHSNGTWPGTDHENVARYEGDVRDRDQWERAILAERPTVIIHLAAETGTGQSLTEATRHTAVNAMGTSQLLDALTATGHRPAQLVVASSRAVYGEGMWRTSDGTEFYPDGRTARQLEAHQWNPLGPNGQPAEPVPHRAGATEPRPSNVYAATKLTQEHLLRAWGTAMNVPVSVLRLQNVYGAGQALDNSYTGVLTYFARQALAGQEINVFEAGGIVRDFVHVSDVANALIAASRRLPRGTSRTVDIGSGASGTLLEFASILAERAGAPAPRVTNDFRLGDVRAASADISAAAHELDYAPTVAFEDGVSELLAWARTELANA